MLGLTIGVISGGDARYTNITLFKVWIDNSAVVVSRGIVRRAHSRRGVIRIDDCRDRGIIASIPCIYIELEGVG